MSGPYGPNDAPGPGEGRNDPTQQWGGQQAPGAAGPTQQWGSAPQAQPTQQWGDPNVQQPSWGQPNPQSQPGQPSWGQPNPQSQPGQPQWGQPNPQSQPSQPQWGQPQPSPPQWGQQPTQQDWSAQQGQQQPWQQGQQQPWQQTPQPSSGGKSKGLFIGLGVLAVAVIGAIVVLVLMLTSKDELDQAAVQDGVKKVLSDSYGIQDVADVSCPSGQQVKVDATFACNLKVSGEQKKVTVKITKDDGTYEVGRPS
ncbi:DUF4333 domain-containing protein [Nocardia sp. NPDC049707]|uniref:DUF4333 domain-containing protein n=1 Tax=Nocardia sp. NPDC049707 TaxID=3154735 RepID=UPI003432AB23